MLGLDFTKRIEARFGAWTWSHLAIAFCFVAAAIPLTNALHAETRAMQLIGMQQNPRPRPKGVVLRWRDRQDPRGFTRPAEAGTTSEEFGLAWISGSDISVRGAVESHRFRGNRAYELTDVIASQVRRVNGRKLLVHEYLIQGARTGDIRRAALHASTDPTIDAIIISLNPVWLFNDWAIYTESNQRASIVAMQGVLPEDWIYAFQYVRPSSIFGALLSKISVLVRYRAAFVHQSGKTSSLAFPLVAPPESPKVHYPATSSFYKGIDFSAPKAMRKHKSYRATLMRQTLSESGQNARFFCLALRSLANSGKPTLLYASPLPPGATEDPRLTAFMHRWSSLVSLQTGKCGGPNISVHTETWRGVAGEIVHRDIVHLHYGQGVIDEVVGMLKEDFHFRMKARGSGAVNKGKAP